MRPRPPPQPRPRSVVRTAPTAAGRVPHPIPVETGSLDSSCASPPASERCQRFAPQLIRCHNELVLTIGVLNINDAQDSPGGRVSDSHTGSIGTTAGFSGVSENLPHLIL